MKMRIMVFCALSLAGLAETARSAYLEVEDATAFYVEPDTSVTFAWKTSKKLRSPLFRLLDYEGKEIARGEVTENGGRVTITRAFPRGFFEAEVHGERFGIVSLPALAEVPDPFFGIDAVLTWLDRRPFSRNMLVGSMKRLGIAIARDRIDWGKVEPAPGKWTWDESDHTQSLRGQYASAGLPVLEMFHSKGPAGGEFPLPSAYPQNLSILASSWPRISQTFRSTWAGLEVWNEPEGRGYGSNLPADQYVVLVKALRYGFQRAGSDSPLGGGVLMGGQPADFHRFCALNGMMENVDFVSLHDYKAAINMEHLIEVYRDWLAKAGREGMPLWVTESGWAWPIGGGRPTLRPDRESAAEIAMKGVEAKACGVARYMPFCLAFYEENGTNSFSMVGKDLTPLRSMAAYAQSIRVLSNASYIGDAPIAAPEILRARVFAREGDAEQMVVLYSAQTEAPALVRPPFEVSRVEGIDGRPLPGPDEDGTMSVPDGLAYVWTKNAGALHSTKAAELLQASRQKVPPAPKAGPIVLQFLPDPNTFTSMSRGYVVTAAAARQLPVNIRVHNLSSETREVRLALEGVAGEPRAVVVPPGDTAETMWRCDVGRFAETPEVMPLRVTGEEADGTPVSPLAIPLWVEGSLEDCLASFRWKKRVALEDVGGWKPSASAGAGVEIGFVDGCWKLGTSFGNGDRWAYPNLPLPGGALAGGRGFVVRAKVKNPADVRMALSSEGARYITFDPLIPGDGNWHVVFVPLSLFEPNQEIVRNSDGRFRAEKVDSISVGLNDRSADRTNVLEVSDLYIVGEE